MWRLCMIFLERGIAAILLVLTWPIIALIYFTISYLAGEPVVTIDSVRTDEGNVLKSFRFRTTGPGKSRFHGVGRFLRFYALGELPGLWSVIQGTDRLNHVLTSSFK